MRWLFATAWLALAGACTTQEASPPAEPVEAAASAPSRRGDLVGAGAAAIMAAPVDPEGAYREECPYGYHRDRNGRIQCD